jgi:multidrug efflux pump subunit AcrA (membrane-fusion protein)
MRVFVPLKNKPFFQFKVLWVLVLGMSLLFYGCSDPEPEAKPGKRDLQLPVQIGKVIFKDVVDEIRGVGNVAAEQRVIITTEVKGRIQEIPVEEGTQVKGGQVLVRIDNRQYRLEAERLKAEQISAQKDYEMALGGLRPEDKEKLQAQMMADESALELAVKELKRSERLVRDGVVSQSNLDEARDRVRQAQETLRSSRAALAAGSKSREEDILKTKSKLESVAKQLALAELDLAKTVIKAPFDGVVISKRIEVGAYAGSGVAILEMIGSSRLKAVFEIPQSYRGKLQHLQEINFFVPDLNLRFKSDKDIRKRVRVIPDANIYSGNIKVQVDLDPGQKKLFPGLTLEGMFRFETRPNVKHVPSVSLAIGEKGTVVYIMKEGRAHLVPVRAYKEKNDLVEVDDFTRQLTPEVDLILRGSGAVFPGVKVFVTNPQPKAEPPFNSAEKKGPPDKGKKPEI